MLFVLWLFLPVWLTPLAKAWYEPGFEEDVAAALGKIRDHDSACIFDDSRKRFVGTPAQLDVALMIERAVSDRAPLPLRHGSDPHFRVYNGRNTFYWSFGESRLVPFRGDRWTLASAVVEYCDARKMPSIDGNRSRDHRNLWTTEESAACCDSLTINQ